MSAEDLSAFPANFLMTERELRLSLNSHCQTKHKILTMVLIVPALWALRALPGAAHTQPQESQS